jgi:hypothetical protein
LITTVYIGFTTLKLSSLPYRILILNLIHQVSDKGLLERCGTGKGYLIEIPPIQSDLRVCASREPKPEQNGPGPWMFSKSTKTGNVLSEIESQGFRKQKGFGPELN